MTARQIAAAAAGSWLVLSLCVAAGGGEIVLQQGVSPADYAGCTDTTLTPKSTAPQAAEAALRLRGVANRALIRFALPKELSGGPIDSAELMLFVPEVTKLEYYAEFICARVLTRWDADARWTSASADARWKAPGGDFDRRTDYANGRPPGAVDSETFFAAEKKYWMPPAHLPVGAGDGGRWVRFDVTAVVEAWLSGTAPNYGLCVTGINVWRKNTPQYAAADVPSAEYAKDKTLRPKLVIRTPDDGPGYRIAAAHTMRRFCDRSPRLRYRGGDVAAHRLAAARGEYEGFQLLVKPIRRTLKDVRLEWTDLTHAKTGAKIPRERLACFSQPTVKLAETWYARDCLRKLHDVPDPLLPFAAADLPRGRATPFWFTLHVPQGAPAGDYTGAIRVVPANAPPRELKLTVHVWNHVIPKRWNFHTMGQTIWRAIRQYHGKITPELTRRYADFLMDHRYAPIEQYSTKLSPNLDYLAEYAARGGNTIYLSGNYRGDLERVTKDFEAVRKLLGEKVREMVCVVYIGDEVTRVKELAKLRRKADTLHAELPGAMVMIGGSYPHKEMIGYLDVYDPKLATAATADKTSPGRLHYKMDDKRAAAVVRPARARGEEMYFYGDLPPLADGLHGGMECPVIGPRLMMWQAWKYGLNGHELYCYNIWAANTKGAGGKKWPEIPWSAESFRGRNGGGMMFYPGPCSSIRLENARDGIEDWECFQVLADCAAALADKCGRHEGRAPEKVRGLERRARQMLAVPEKATGGFTEWTRDGETVLADRARLSRLIEEHIEVVGEAGYERAAAARRKMETDRRADMLRRRGEQARKRLQTDKGE